jgi:hypothetical protein
VAKATWRASDRAPGPTIQNSPTIFYTLRTQEFLPPTLVRLQSFKATEYEGGKVLLEWRTGYEVDNLGFHVYREEAGQLYRLTPEMVAGSAFLIGSGTPLTAGRKYTWVDFLSEDSLSALHSQPSAIKYWLKDMDLNGTQTMHGPVTPVITEKAVPETRSPEFLSSLGLSVQERYQDYWKIQELKEKLALARLEAPGTSRLRRDSRIACPVEYSPSIPQDKLKAGRTELLALSPGGTLLKPLKAGRRGKRSDQKRLQQWTLAEKPAVKLLVREEGWYRVSQPELVTAGLDPKTNPRLLQLFVDGKEQPLRVINNGGIRFGSGDAIEFYGVGLDTPLYGYECVLAHRGETPRTEDAGI